MSIYWYTDRVLVGKHICGFFVFKMAMTIMKPQLVVKYTARLKIVGKEVFQYPTSGPEKYHNEFPPPKKNRYD